MPLIATIPRQTLESRALLGHGFTVHEARLIPWLESEIEWRERGPAESDATRKQLIPYVITLRGDAVFVTERLTGGNERRLHGRRSIGIGGHVELDSHGTVGVLERGLWREWYEEVDAPDPRTLRFAGVVNDDTVEVGRYHLGLVYVADLPDESRVSVRETNKLTGRFMQRDQLLVDADRLESWSALILEPASIWSAITAMTASVDG